jgi:hypothetical protein
MPCYIHKETLIFYWTKMFIFVNIFNKNHHK